MHSARSELRLLKRKMSNTKILNQTIEVESKQDSINAIADGNRNQYQPLDKLEDINNILLTGIKLPKLGS